MDRSTPSILALDTTALLATITDVPARPVVLEALDRHDVWCASELALSEGLPAIDRLTDETILREDLESALRQVWDRLYTVPVDPRCLGDAARIARRAPARICDAIHIAAASRLPRPTSYVTLDPAQIRLAELFDLVPISL